MLRWYVKNMSNLNLVNYVDNIYNEEKFKSQYGSRFYTLWVTYSEELTAVLPLSSFIFYLSASHHRISCEA